MTHRRSCPLLAAACALLGCAANPYQPPPNELPLQFRFPLDQTKAGAVEIRVCSGHVLVQPGATLTCEARVEVRAADAGECERRAATVVAVPDADDDGVAVVELQAPGVPDDCLRISYALQVPADVAVRIFTRRARVAVRGYAGTLAIDSDAGPVAARLGAGADATIHTVSGSVRVEGDFARAAVSTQTGAVTVLVDRSGPAPQVEVETASGDVTFELDPDSRIAFEGRTRSTKVVACELAADWDEYGVTDHSRWKRYRGALGTRAGDATAHLRAATATGQLALRCLPGG